MANNKNSPSPKSFEELISEYEAAGGEYSKDKRKASIAGTYSPPHPFYRLGKLGNININPNASLDRDDKSEVLFHEFMHMLDDKSSPDYPEDKYTEASYTSDKLEDLAKKQGKPLIELLEDLAFKKNMNPERAEYISDPTEFVSHVTTGGDESFYDDLEDMFDPFKPNTPRGGEKSIHDLVRLTETVNESFDIGKENIKGGKDIFSSKSINFLNSYIENTRNKYLSLGDSQKDAKGDDILKQIQESYNKEVKSVVTKHGIFKRFVPDKSPNKYNLAQKYERPWY